MSAQATTTRRYGVVEFDDRRGAIDIEEELLEPGSGRNLSRVRHERTWQ